jgi:hypothetical protein
MSPTLADVNTVLAAINPAYRFEQDGRRLFIVTPVARKQLQQDRRGGGTYPTARPASLGMGGTEAMAVVQLYLWLLDRPRRPLHCWRHWAAIGLGRGRDLIGALEASGYDDPAATCCVLCGAPSPSDWWARDAVIGPCCSFGVCADDRHPQCTHHSRALGARAGLDAPTTLSVVSA